MTKYKTRFFILLSLLLCMLMCLTSCSSETIEIDSIDANLEKNTLSVKYKCGVDISENDWKVKVSLSQDNEKMKGTVYRIIEGNSEREKGINYLQLLTLNGITQWTTEGSFTYDGETGTGEVGIMDVLNEFGTGTIIKVTFYVKDAVVAEKQITL